jgi:NodT family efflux transporter outer membrane factor (OMF) lipoprotein
VAEPAPDAVRQPLIPSALLVTYPVLRDLFAEVRVANAEREAAVARWAQAKALAEAANAQAGGLTVALSASANRNQASREVRGGLPTPVVTQTQVGATVGWDPDLFGKNRAAERAAALRAEAAKWDLARVERALLLEAARAYFEWLAAHERLTLNAAQREVVGRSQELIAARVAAGLASEREAMQVATLIAQLQAQRAQLLGRRAAAEERLALVTGGKRLPLSDASASAPLPVPVAADLPVDLVRRRPEVQLAERRLLAAIAEATRAEAARYPSLPLTGTLAWAAANPAAMWQMSAAAWALAANLTLTLFDGGRQAAELDAALAAVREAAANYRQAVLAAVAEVEQAAAALASNDERRVALDAAAAAAERAWQLLSAQYAAGLVDYALVLEAQRTWLTAQEAAREALAQSRSDRLQWEYALGANW